MKRKAIRREFHNSIKYSLSRFISILLITALGVAFFSGIRSTKRDMELSADAFYDDTRLMDIRVISTLGLSEEDVLAIRQVKGVEDAEPAYAMDALCDIDSSQLVVKVLSRMDRLNQIRVTKGRLPRKANECLVDELFVGITGHRIGDTISLHLEEGEDILDHLSHKEFTITGIGSSPTYLSLERGSSSIGNGNISSFIVVMPDTFLLEAYTDIYVSAEDAKDAISYTEAYQDKVDPVVDRIKDIADTRREARYQEIKEEASSELEDARAKLDEEEGKVRSELADAAHQLEDARIELKEGEKALAEGKAKLKKGKAQLEEGKKELKASEKEIQRGLEELSAAEAQIAEGKKQLQEQQEALEEGLLALEGAYGQWHASMEEWNGQRAALEKNEAQVTAALEALISEKAKLDPVKAVFPEEWQALLEAEQTLLHQQEQIATGKAALDEGKIQLDEAKARLDQEQEKLNQGQRLLAEEGQKLETAEKTLTENRQQIQEGQARIQDGWKEIRRREKQIKDSETLLAEKAADLAEGKETLAEKEKEYEEAAAKAEEELAEARQKIADGEEELAKLEYPEWYVLDRNSIQTYVEYGHDSERIGNIGKVFPAIFFLVAALVCLTTMTRMVEEERTQIGTLKALGYSKATIAAKYILYAFFASFLGSVFGVLLGEKLLPMVIISAYRILYASLPKVIAPYNLYYSILSTLAAVTTTTLASFLACYKEMLSPPSQLMRPAAPKAGKRVLLERIPWLWRLFNFSTKATIRNLLRYKKRFFMTVFGIGGCMALLLVGFGLKDSISAMSDIQYVDLWHQDAVAVLQKDANDGNMEDLDQYLDGNPERIKDRITIHDTTVDAGKGRLTKSASLLVPEDPDHLKEYILLRDRITRQEFPLRDGSVIITEKLASLLGIEEGESIQLSSDGVKPKEIKVAHIVENYMMHYVFMTPATYTSLYGTPPEYNRLYMKLGDLPKSEEDDLASDLLAQPAIASITFTSALQQNIDDMLSRLNTVVYVLILSAGLLAFVVLYNLNNININERQRELATLKVLGFQDTEVATYVYRENILLTIIGILVGVFLGILLHRYVILTTEIDIIMFGRRIHWISFIYSTLLTFVFSGFVNLVMYYKLRNIDMVESLKSVE